MTMRATALVLCGAAALVLAGCGEKMAGAVKRSDTPAFQGAAEPSAFTAGAWKAGDRNSWEQELRRRTQTQNEYVRIQP